MFSNSTMVYGNAVGLGEGSGVGLGVSVGDAVDVGIDCAAGSTVSAGIVAVGVSDGAMEPYSVEQPMTMMERQNIILAALFISICPFRPRHALHMGCRVLLSESAVRSDRPLGAAQSYETGNVEAVRTLREVAVSDCIGRQILYDAEAGCV